MSTPKIDDGYYLIGNGIQIIKGDEYHCNGKCYEGRWFSDSSLTGKTIPEVEKEFPTLAPFYFRRETKDNIAGKGYRLLNDNEIPGVGCDVKCQEFPDWKFMEATVNGMTVGKIKEVMPEQMPIYYRTKVKNQNMSTVNIKPPAVIRGNDFISLSFNGVPTTIYKQDNRFEKVIEIIKSKQWDKLECAINTAKAIAKFSAGKVEVFDGVVMYNGKEVKNVVVNKILSFMKEEFPIEALVNFLEKLMQNPSERSKEQLYGYLEMHKLPICEDGDFISYKSITNEWKDHHTQTIDNSIGQIVKLPRETINDDPNHSCHVGLHIGAESYVRTFGDGIGIIVKVNPKNVVCIPYNVSSQKMRVCEYEVISKFGKNTEITDFKSDYAPANEQMKKPEVSVSDIGDEGFTKEDFEDCTGKQNPQSNDNFIRSQKGKVTDTELRKIIRDTYNVKKTQGNAIFNRLFSGAKVAKIVKVEVKKNILSSNAAWEAFKNGENMSNGKFTIDEFTDNVTRDFIRKNKGWYIV